MSSVSYLFAVEAEQLLLAEMPEEAIALCRKGIEFYPEYPAAYGILARSYCKIGKYEDAKMAIEYAIKRFPNNKSLRTVSEELTASGIVLSHGTEQHRAIYEDYSGLSAFDEPEEKILDFDEQDEKTESYFDNDNLSNEIAESKRLVKVDGKEFLKKFADVSRYKEGHFSADVIDLIPGLNEIEDKDSEYHKLSPELPEYEVEAPSFPPMSFEDDEEVDLTLKMQIKPMKIPDFSEVEETEVARGISIEELAKKLQDAKTPLPVSSSREEPVTRPSKAPPVVTDTIAMIYERQGAFEAAIDAYLKLGQKYPEKKDYYQSKIAGLREKLASA